MTQVSDRLASLSPSATLAMSQKSGELKAQGIDVINLSVGEPDFNTPDFIKEAAKKAIDDNFSRYSPVAGYPALRNAIVAKLKNENGLEYTAGQISCANGAKQSVCNTVMVLVNPGDEVIIPAPFWVSYPEMVKLAEGTPVIVPAGIEQDFKITPAQLEAAITPKTKALILCSPSNPTGSVYSAEELAGLAEVLKKHPDIIVIADEIYEHINYIGKHNSIASIEGMKDRTVIVNGVSKAYAMTGWRIGFIAGPEWIVKAVNKLQGQYTSGPCSVSQKAAEAAYTGSQEPVEEMRKAYDTGAKRYWLLNVGDIKPGELGMKTFLDMAWDIDKFDFDNINNHQVDFLVSIFGERYREDIEDVMNSYYHLGFQHKPEAMGWGYEWNNEHVQERMTDTDFSFINYNEAEGRIQEYDRISDKSEKIWNALPESHKAAFYELVFYPVKGAALMNKKMLVAQQNRWYARQGRTATNYLADRVKSYHDSIDYYTDKYNSLLNGKWNHMMALAPGWTATYQKMPPLTTIDVPQKAEMRIFLPEQDSPLGKTTLNVLPCVNPYTRKESFIELYNVGKQVFTWNAKTSDSWIKLSRQNGTTQLQERIIVSVDWVKVPVGERITGEIEVISGGRQEKVYLPVFNPAYPTVGELKGWYVEDNGCVSINPGKYHRKVENEDIKIKVIKGLGYENQCIQLGEAVEPVQNPRRSGEAAKVEYDFYTFNAGSVTVYTYALPVFPVNSERGTCFGIMIDNGLLKYASNNAKEYSGEWRENVYRNSTINAVTLNIDKPGKHTLKLICSDPGMIIQKVVIDMGGMKRSYLGPETTIVR